MFGAFLEFVWCVMFDLQSTQKDAPCKPKADLLFNAILDGIEDWYGKERTRGQMGLFNGVYNCVLMVPGL